MMAEIFYVPKETLYPSFGAYRQGRIEVRADLPRIVQAFVLANEQYHAEDKTDRWWLWQEVSANWAAFKKEPLGGMVTVLMSLSPARLWFYWDRARRGK